MGIAENIRVDNTTEFRAFLHEFSEWNMHIPEFHATSEPQWFTFSKSRLVISFHQILRLKTVQFLITYRCSGQFDCASIDIVSDRQLLQIICLPSNWLAFSLIQSAHSDASCNQIESRFTLSQHQPQTIFVHGYSTFDLNLPFQTNIKIQYDINKHSHSIYTFAVYWFSAPTNYLPFSNFHNCNAVTETLVFISVQCMFINVKQTYVKMVKTIFSHKISIFEIYSSWMLRWKSYWKNINQNQTY